MSPGLFNCANQNITLRFLFKSRNRKCSAIIKADQINVLRKQYDAFLEEDKKRKERNEHILEKLDTMRLTNTVARYKSNFYLDQRLSFNYMGEAPLKIYPHLNEAHQPATVNPLRKLNETAVPNELDVLNKPLHTGETYILNDISKKYILIPKLSTITGADYVPRGIKQDNNNDIDWKSKYSILDKLKQNEKEETNSFAVLKGQGKSFLDDIPTKEHTYRFDEANSPKGEIEETKKDMIATNYDTLDEKETINSISTDVRTEKIKAQPEVTPELNKTTKVLKTDTDSGCHLQQPDRGPINLYTDPTKDVGEQLATLNTGDHHNDATYNDKYENEDNEKRSPVVDDIRYVEEIDPIKPEPQKTKSDILNTGDSEKLQYPIDIINVQDFTPAEGVKLVDGVNINPDNPAVQQKFAPSEQYADQALAKHTNLLEANQPQQNSDVQYLNQPTGSSDQIHLPMANQLPADHSVSEPTVFAEQVYMPGDQQTRSGDQYVTEPVPVAAEQQEHIKDNPGQQQQQQQGEYDQTGDVTSEIQAFEDEQKGMFYSEQTDYHDQNVVGDVYSADTDYDPTIYYGGVQQQQEAAYPTEINEHEETSQRYDPSYEEQYGEQQQYNEQQYAEQYAEQQYDGQPLYGDQQQYSDQLYGDQQYAEQQHYTDQHEGQSQGDPTMIETLQDYDPAYALQEQTMEQIEQQLDNEELNVPGVPEGNVADESSLYAQNAGDLAATEQ